MKLSNQEIWIAYPNLKKLWLLPLTFEISLKVSSLVFKLEKAYTAIELEREKLCHKYGKLNPEKQVYEVKLDGETAADFAGNFGELLKAEWHEDFDIIPVEISESVSFLIQDVNILMPLVGKFIKTNRTLF